MLVHTNLGFDLPQLAAELQLSFSLSLNEPWFITDPFTWVVVLFPNRLCVQSDRVLAAMLRSSLANESAVLYVAYTNLSILQLPACAILWTTIQFISLDWFPNHWRICSGNQEMKIPKDSSKEISLSPDQIWPSLEVELKNVTAKISRCVRSVPGPSHYIGHIPGAVALSGVLLDRNRMYPDTTACTHLEGYWVCSIPQPNPEEHSLSLSAPQHLSNALIGFTVTIPDTWKLHWLCSLQEGNSCVLTGWILCVA